MRVLLLAAVAISMAGCSHAAGGALPITAGAASSAAGPRLSGLRVTGNELVDGSNNVVHLRGVNRSGTEYACVQGWGIFDGLSTPRRSKQLGQEALRACIDKRTFPDVRRDRTYTSGYPGGFTTIPEYAAELVPLILETTVSSMLA